MRDDKLKDNDTNKPDTPPGDSTAAPKADLQADKAKTLAALEDKAKTLGFRNPQLAARYASFEPNGEDALNRLASSDPHLVTPKVAPTNPEVKREPAKLADKLRNVMTARRARPF